MARRKKLTNDEARERVERYIANLRHDYEELWQRYREVVRENAKLHERLSRYEWQAKCRESEREAENMRYGG